MCPECLMAKRESIKKGTNVFTHCEYFGFISSQDKDEFKDKILTLE